MKRCRDLGTTSTRKLTRRALSALDIFTRRRGAAAAWGGGRGGEANELRPLVDTCVREGVKWLEKVPLLWEVRVGNFWGHIASRGHIIFSNFACGSPGKTGRDCMMRQHWDNSRIGGFDVTGGHISSHHQTNTGSHQNFRFVYYGGPSLRAATFWKTGMDTDRD